MGYLPGAGAWYCWLALDFFRRYRRNAPTARSAIPATLPTTMPAIAPPDRPPELDELSADGVPWPSESLAF